MKRITLFLILVMSVTLAKAQASTPFLGQVAFVPFNYSPMDWKTCDGSLLNINEYSDLFSLIGTTYGGDGQSTFALPDMRGRVPIHVGARYAFGEFGGEEDVTLSINQIPSHSHTVKAVTTSGNNNIPTGAIPADTKLLDKEYSSAVSDAKMNTNMISNTGGGLPHNNMQPYLTLKCIIAVQGVFPSQN